MDHIIGISNKTCFSENKKPNNLGEQFLHLTIFLCWQFWQKHYGCGGGWELIFYIQVEFIFYCISKPKRADWYFQKGLKNMYKKNIVYSNQTYCVKISWIVYRMKIEAMVFRIVWRNFLLLFTTLIQDYKMDLCFRLHKLPQGLFICIPRVFSS